MFGICFTMAFTNAVKIANYLRLKAIMHNM